MAFKLSQLERASFRGVTFFLDVSNRRGGRRNNVYEIPDTDLRISRDRGKFLRSFDIEGVISGVRYKQVRDRLIRAFEQEGPGKLIHPFYGEVNCVLDGQYVLNEDLKQAGIATFTVLFIEVKDESMPKNAVNNQSLINRIASDIREGAENFSDEVFNITEGFFDVFQDAGDAVNDIAAAFDAVTQPFDAASDALGDFSVQINNFQNNIFNNLNTPSNLFNQVTGLFDGLNNLSTNANERFSSFQSLFGFDLGYDDIPETTFPRIEKRSNRQVLQTNMAFNALAAAYNAAALIDYSTEEEIVEIQGILETQFDYAVDNTNLDAALTSQLEDLRTQFQFLLDNEVKEDNKRIVIVDTQPTNVTSLVYTYYGNLDNVELINDLNQFPNPSNISGLVKIISAT